MSETKSPKKRPIQPGDGADVVAQTKEQMMQSIPSAPAAPTVPVRPKEAQENQQEGTPAGVKPETQVNSTQSYSLDPIGEVQVRDAYATLQKYKSAKASLDARIRENELWYRLRHGSQYMSSTVNAAGERVPRNPTDPDMSTAWLLNALVNKHADAMDNYPAATVLPQEENDQEDAKMLTSILPTVLEQNDYESAYSDMWWYKLKMGTGAMQVTWDATKLNGLGDVSMRKVDLLNLFWEPNIPDLQKSRNIFHVELQDRDDVAAQYPDVADAINRSEGTVNTYQYDDAIPTDGKVDVVDWYYKKRVGSKIVLHYCKFSCGQVLYASENSPKVSGNPDDPSIPDYTQRGYYDHGKYPFIFDVLFPEEGMPYGFGYIDVCKNPQMYIDKMDSIYIKHAAMGGRARYFKRKGANFNDKDVNDYTKDVVEYEGSMNPNDVFFPIAVPQLDSNYLAIRTAKIDELKETSGNRDFSQGSVSGGVTAASAIAALQEASNKSSRDNIKGTYRSFKAMCYMALDIMRQFYTEPRMFRIIGEQGEMQFKAFDAQRLSTQQAGGGFLPETSRMPFFDITVVAMKSSPFSTIAQNERAKEMFGMGFFRPDIADQALACLKMMYFEGIEQVRQTISQNGTLFQNIQELGPIALMMAQALDAMDGGVNGYTQKVARLVQQYMAVTSQPGSGGNETQVSALGEALNGARNSAVGTARKNAASTSTPK